jgi:hypothetical protein
MSVAFSGDHRVLDGALAAQWLSAFIRRIEHPLTIVLLTQAHTLTVSTTPRTSAPNEARGRRR